MHKGNKSLNKKQANDILQNVFEQCDVTPNSTPFGMIMFKSASENKLVYIFKCISIFFLIFVLLSPLTFRRDPNFTIVESSRQVTIENHALYADSFVLTLHGRNIDYENIYAKKDDGAYIFPSSVDENSGTVIFPYNGESLNIFIPSGDNDLIQAVLHENKNN